MYSYHIYRTSVFPELFDFHISRSMTILEISKKCKYVNLEIVKILNLKIMYISRMNCICMYACMFVDKCERLPACVY